MQSESMAINGQCCQPGGSPFFLREIHGTLERGWELALEVFGILLLLCALVGVDSLLDILLSSMAIAQPLILIDDSLDKRGTDHL